MRNIDVPEKNQLNYEINWNLPALSINYQTNISKDTTVRFAQYLTSIIEEKRKGLLYSPHCSQDKTVCVYQWHEDFNNKTLELKFILWFQISMNTNITEINVLIQNSTNSKDFEQPPILNNKQQKTISNIVLNQIIKPAAHFASFKAKKKNFYFLFCLKTQPLTGNNKNIQLQGFTVLPTIYLEKQQECITPIIVKVKEYSRSIAKVIAVKELSYFISLLSLTSEAHFSLAKIKWDNGLEPVKTLFKIKPIPKLKDLFKSPFKLAELANNKFYKRAKFVDTLLKSNFNNKEKFLNSAIAYFNAYEILLERPTLATISFVASLSILKDIKKCGNTINCDVCGRTLQPHDLSGERASIFEKLATLFNLKEGEDKFSTLKSLFTRIYYNHRSSFVHEAIFRHREEFIDDLDLNLISLYDPQDEAGESVTYTNDLYSFEAVTRKGLLHFIADKLNLELNEDLFEIKDFKYKRMMLPMKISIPANSTVKLPVI